MFRPACVIRRGVLNDTVLKDCIRTKVIKSPSILNPAEKLKLYQKENKELFGPLLEKKKAKKLRSQKAAKNSQTSHQNNGTVVDSEKPGYASEDNILQIKPHQNDFAKQYPSVTLILNKTMTEESRAALEKWKKERIAEMGLEAFNKFYEAQLALGTKFHSTLKNYFTQPQTQLRIDKDVEGVWNSVQDVLKSISSPKAIESNVVHPVLKYRGIFDAIADYEDKPTLIEWKKSEKARRAISLTYDNPVQLAAYFGAVCNDLNYKHLNRFREDTEGWKEAFRRKHWQSLKMLRHKTVSIEIL
ncbi:unnamed protein product, partial [Iphiclides podalirius]